MKIFHKILPKLLLICCLVFEFSECSRKLQLSTSFPEHNDEEEQNKNSKIGKLVPKRHVPKVENLSPSYWTFHPFPLSDVIDDTEVYSRAITHSQSNISTFAYVKEESFGQSMLLSKERKAKTSYVCALGKPSTLISFFGKQVMLTSGRYFTNIDTTARLDSPNWNCLDETLSEDEVHKDDFIVTGKLVSETEGFLLTSMGLLFSVAWMPFFACKLADGVVNFASKDDLLATVTKDPHSLTVFQDADLLCKIEDEPLVDFSEKATIVLTDQQFILFHDKLQSKLLNMNTRKLVDIPVGAEMMYFEDPWLLALDGTTFTKYNIDGNALQRYTFQGVIRVIPDNRWTSFALHYSQVLERASQIQYVSRKVDYEAQHLTSIAWTYFAYSDNSLSS